MVWTCLPFINLGKNNLARQWKGVEDKADRKRGGKTISENGQAWSSPSRRGQWRTEKTVKLSVVPQRPQGLRDRWRWRKVSRSPYLGVCERVFVFRLLCTGMHVGMFVCRCLCLGVFVWAYVSVCCSLSVMLRMLSLIFISYRLPFLLLSCV